MNTSDFSAWHAFVYRDGIMTGLAPFLASIGLAGNASATGVDDAGNIIGHGTSADGQTRAFLITAVPEPSTAALLVLAAVGFTLALRP